MNEVTPSVPSSDHPDVARELPPVTAGIATPALGTVGPGTPQRKMRYFLILLIATASLAAYMLLQPRHATPSGAKEPDAPANQPAARAPGVAVPRATSVVAPE